MVSREFSFFIFSLVIFHGFIFSMELQQYQCKEISSEQNIYGANVVCCPVGAQDQFFLDVESRQGCSNAACVSKDVDDTEAKEYKKSCFYIAREDKKIFFKGDFVKGIIEELGIKKKWQDVVSNHISIRDMQRDELSQNFLEKTEDFLWEIEKDFEVDSNTQDLLRCDAIDIFLKESPEGGVKTYKDLWRSIGLEIRKKLSNGKVSKKYKNCKTADEFIKAFYNLTFIDEDLEVPLDEKVEKKGCINPVTKQKGGSERFDLIERYPKLMLDLIDSCINEGHTKELKRVVSIAHLAKISRNFSFAEFYKAFNALRQIGAKASLKLLFNILAANNPRVIKPLLDREPDLKKLLSAAQKHPYRTVKYKDGHNTLDSLGLFSGAEEEMHAAFSFLIEIKPSLLESTEILAVIARYNPRRALNLMRIYPNEYLPGALHRGLCESWREDWSCQRRIFAIKSFEEAFIEDKITYGEFKYIKDLASRYKDSLCTIL